MRLSFHHQYQSQLLLPIPIRLPPATATTALRRPTKCRATAAASGKEKIVVIMGATGAGKSRLSVDLATSPFLLPSSAEIINSDKMQVYRGLDITTNKTPLPDRRGVPHHLLGDLHPSLGDVSPSLFRLLARSALSRILSRRRLPLIVGGSNSFVHALVTRRVHPPESSLHYDCCFIWVDVALPVLNRYLLKRVDDMFDSGMLAELAEFYDSLESGDSALRPGVGIMKAIGVPEFARYFRRGGGDAGEFGEAVERIKYNTCQLAVKQMGKIERLRLGGWEMRRIDATEFFEAVMRGETAEEIWEKRVLMPSVNIVKSFLDG